MPQGVTNAPSTFQRLMERCMGDLYLKEVLVFLHDLIIFSNTLEEHEGRLLRVLQRLRLWPKTVTRKVQILSDMFALSQPCCLGARCGDGS